jgi:hypothetical protein
MSRWHIVALASSLGEYAGQWDRLNERVAGNHPMLTSLFIDGLLRHFGDGAEHLCRFVDDGQVQAMCIVRRRNQLVWASFLPAQGQLGPTLIPDTALLPSLLRSLPGPAMQLDLLCNDPTVGAVLAQPLAYHRNHNFTMTIGLDTGFEQYWASRSRGLQSNMRRYEKRLLAEGITQRYVRICAADDIEAAVERYARLEGDGWKGLNGTSLASSAAQLRFYREAMAAAAASGDASVHELWFGDELAASRLILARGRTQVMLKTTYAEKFAAYAPGRLLLRAVIQHAFSMGSKGKIEFCTDAAPDLLGWATDQRWVQHASVYRSPFAKHMILAMSSVSKRRALLHHNSAANRGLTAQAFPHPDRLPADARKLLNRGERTHIEFGTAWYRNLVDTVYPGDTSIRFYTLRREEKIVAVLPLRAEKVLLGWRLHSLSNQYTTLYEPGFEPGLKPRELGFLLAAIDRDFPGLASLRLAPMNPASSAYQTLLDSLQFMGWLAFQTSTSGSWHQSVVAGTEQALVARNAAVRAVTRPLEDKFLADGGRLEIVAGTSDWATAAAAAEEIFARAHQAGHPDFMPGLLRTYSDQGCLRLGLAWFGDQPVAAQVWVVAHGRATIYARAHDAAFAHYAPDTLISVMLTAHVTEVDEVSEVAYLSGHAPYHNTWKSHRRERRSIVVHNAGSLRGLAGLARESLKLAASRFLLSRAGVPTTTA